MDVQLTCIFSYCFRYTEFGGPVPKRPAEDLAFAVARFIQKGGSFVNYYMVSNFFWCSPAENFHVLCCRCLQFNTCVCQYHGGTNFGRTAGGPFIATSYDYDAPLDEFGMCFYRSYRMSSVQLFQCTEEHISSNNNNFHP